MPASLSKTRDDDADEVQQWLEQLWEEHGGLEACRLVMLAVAEEMGSMEAALDSLEAFLAANKNLMN